MDERIALGLACLTLSLQLKNGERDDMTLADLHARAERLPVTDPLYLAITEAVVQAEIAHAPAALAEIGHSLHHALSVMLTPTPPGQDRSDIHG